MKVSLNVLKKRYDDAVERNDKQFTLKSGGESAELLTTFAKYMIEYLEGEYERRKLPHSYKTELVPSTTEPKEIHTAS